MGQGFVTYVMIVCLAVAAAVWFGDEIEKVYDRVSRHIGAFQMPR